MVSLVSGRGSDHERWLNTQLETVGVACEGWFDKSEVAAEVPQKFKLVDVEKLARRRNGKFEDAYDALSLELPAQRAGRDGAVSTGAEREAHRRVHRVGRGRLRRAARLRGARVAGRLRPRRRVAVAGARGLRPRRPGRRPPLPRGHRREGLAQGQARAPDPGGGLHDAHRRGVWAHRFYGDGAGICRVGGVWLPAKASPQIFEVAGLQKKVRELLATEVNDLLTADAHARAFDTDTDDWVLRGSCETCNFRASCEKQAANRGRLCALPGLRADDAVELQNFSAGAAGRNAIERLETAVRNMDPSTTKSTRRALARGIHLQYEDDEPPSELPPTLRAWRENVIVPTGRPSASLPYLHAEEVACVCICVDEHFRSRAPMAFVVASAPHHGAPSQRSLVVDYAPFAGDAHANVAVNAARAARVRLVSAVYEALLPFNGRRVCVCVPEAADKSALFDAVLRIAMESETSDLARRARLVIATLGAEPAHLLLAGNCPTLGDEAREAHQFLPRCSVLVEEAKRLFAVPSVRATTFEDCCAYLPRDRDLRADAAECSREAVFRIGPCSVPGSSRASCLSDRDQVALQDVT